MASMRKGIEFPIIPEDLEYSDDELSPCLLEYLLFVSSISESKDSADTEDPICLAR
jgi:hypothetical protein